MDRYSVSIAKRVPSVSSGPTFTELGPLVASGLSWSEALLGEGEATASTDPRTLDPDIVDALEEALDNDDDVPGLELWIARGSNIAHRGPIVGLQHQGQTLSFVSRGPLYYLRLMYVLALLEYSSTDQYSIAAGLISQWQTEDYGDFGFDVSGVGTSGTTRDRTYEKGDDVFERLFELADVDGGFDVWVDHETREVFFGTKGTDKTTTVVLDRRGITDAGLAISLAAGDLASEALALNTDDESPLSSTSTNTTLRNSFGKSGVVGSFDGVTVQSTLDDHAAGLQAARSRPLITPTPELIPVSGAGVFDFEAGDSVQFVPRIGIPGIALERRVLKKTVTVGDDGNETIGVEFS